MTSNSALIQGVVDCSNAKGFNDRAARLEHGISTVREAAVDALRGQLALALEILERVSAGLEDEDSSVRRAAVDTLTGQSELTLEILERVAARLEDEDSEVRKAAVDALTGQSALTQEVLSQYLDPLYRALLGKSFDEPFSWFNMDGISYIAASDREVLCTCFRDQFKRAIRETQTAIGAPLAY